jgi:Protein of unknown function (DUF429)
MAWLNSPTQFFAVDWSGNATLAGQRRHIFVASWTDGVLALESGFTREAVCELLLAAAERNPNLVAGLDFAFSFPAWWVRQLGCVDASAVWQLAAQHGEQWLRESKPPFWGRPGETCPSDHRAPRWLGFRTTDRGLNIKNCAIQPKSPFQIGGAGAVGTGSIRGMPILARLHRGGFRTWPFQSPELPLVLEIYPRLFTGAVVKSSRDAREVYLRRSRFTRLPKNVRAKAIASEDAFDALCALLGMIEHAQHLTTLKEESNEEMRLEGVIWNPMPTV